VPLLTANSSESRSLTVRALPVAVQLEATGTEHIGRDSGFKVASLIKFLVNAPGTWRTSAHPSRHLFFPDLGVGTVGHWHESKYYSGYYSIHHVRLLGDTMLAFAASRHHHES